VKCNKCNNEFGDLDDAESNRMPSDVMLCEVDLLCAGGWVDGNSYQDG
jgi:hypothetical protein